MSQTSSSYDPKYTWDRNPTRNAPPAVTVPPPDYPVESSHFSPESHRSSHRFKPQRTRSRSTWTNTLTLRSLTRDPESGKPSAPQTPQYRDRITKFLFDLRMPTHAPETQWYPMQEAPLQSWPPLDVEKHRFCHHCRERNDRRRRNRVLIAALVVFLVYLFANLIFLNVRITRLSSRSSSVSPTTGTSTVNSSVSGLSEDAQSCLSQYSLNAPSDPQSYPCSTCLPVLQNVPSNFTDASQQDGQQILNAIQFCGLRSVFESAGNDGQTGLSNGGWVKDVRFCAWSGVRCDGFGRVSSLQLSFPAVPAKIPDEIGALAGLTSLQVVGDTNVPAGDLPASFKSLGALTTLHLESTAVTSISSDVLKSLSKLSTLTLVKNGKMSGDLTPGLISLLLVNLVINNQALPSNPASALLTSPAKSTLRTLDLSSTSLSGSLPSDLSPFSALIELHLDNNSLTNPLPSQFPPNLQSLTLTGNSQLGGAVASGTSFCSLAQLKTCDVRGSGLSAQGNCGVCQFS